MSRPISTFHRFTRSALLAVGCAALLLAACADYKTPAKETLDKVEASLNNVARDAAKYAPEDLKKAQDDLAAARVSFDSGDYEKALLGARSLAEAVPKLATLAGEKRNEVMKQLSSDWQQLSGSLPKLMDTIGAKVAALSKARKQPAGFDQAKSDYDAAKATLEEATKASASGNLEEAVTKAKSVEEKAKSIAATLGIKI